MRSLNVSFLQGMILALTLLGRCWEFWPELWARSRLCVSAWLVCASIGPVGSRGMSSLKELERSFLYELLYPPQPQAMVEACDGPNTSPHVRMYHNYLRVHEQACAGDVPVSQSFLQWHREHKYDASSKDVVQVRLFFFWVLASSRGLLPFPLSLPPLPPSFCCSLFVSLSLSLSLSISLSLSLTLLSLSVLSLALSLSLFLPLSFSAPSLCLVPLLVDSFPSWWVRILFFLFLSWVFCYFSLSFPPSQVFSLSLVLSIS